MATATVTATGQATATSTATAVATATPTITITGTLPATSTVTVTATPTITITGTLPATSTVTATATPSNTGVATATASVTATPTGGAVGVEVGTAVGRPGTTVGFSVTFSFTGQFQIVAINQCIDVNPLVPFARNATNGPDCTVNAALQKPDSTFRFEPDGCDPDVDCESMCADIRGPAGSPVIPVGAALFSCRIAVPGDAADGEYPLQCAASGSATTFEGGTTRVDCEPGAVIVQTNLPGDCNGDGMVTINELIIGVNIALNNLPVTACPAFDTDASGSVTIDELIAAVNVALET
jgi:hypothetical protein